MALGNNLRKKKLLPDNADNQVDNKETSPKQPALEKKAVKRKSAVKRKKTGVTKEGNTVKPKTTKTSNSKTTKPKSNKSTPKKVDKPTKVQKLPNEKIVVDEKAKHVSVEKPINTITNEKLPVYIAKELLEKKRNLRKRYQEEVALLQEKGSIQYVIISIGSESYAIEIDNIKEIVPITDISKTPNTPSHIKGLANVRGKTYVVFDLAEKFKVKGDEFPKYLLVLNNRVINSSLTLSILPSTLKVKGANISSDLQIIEDALLDASYIKGIIQNGEQLIYYLDIIELIKNEKAIVVPDELLDQVND